MASRLDNGAWATLPADWTESSGAYTHASGATGILTNNTTIFTQAYYIISYEVTNYTSGSFTINLGGRTSSAITATGTWKPDATLNKSQFTVVPTSDFVGTVKFSLGRVYSSSAATVFYAKGGSSFVGHENKNKNSYGLDDISKNLSGVVIEQNKKNQTITTDGVIEQEFTFPKNYARGDKIPPLTGFELYLTGGNDNTEVEYEIQRYDASYKSDERLTEAIRITNVSVSTSGNTADVTYTTAIKHGFKIQDVIKTDGFNNIAFNTPANAGYTVLAKTDYTFTIRMSNDSNYPNRVADLTNGSTIKGWVFPYAGRSNSVFSIINSIRFASRESNDFVEATLTLPKNQNIYNQLSKYANREMVWGDFFRFNNVGSLNEELEPFEYMNMSFVLNSISMKRSFIEMKMKIDISAWDRGALNEVIKNKYIFNKNKPVIELVFDRVVNSLTGNLVGWEVWPLAWSPINENFDSPYGWQKVSTRNKFTLKAGHVGWKKVLFSSLELPENWIEDKFKLIIKPKSNITYHYLNPALTNQNFYINNAFPNPSGSLVMRVLGGVADDGEDFLSNQFRSTAIKNNVEEVLNSENTFWCSKPNPSKYGVESLYFDVSAADGNAVVIDSVFLDSITPNVKFNIYYSNDPAGPGTDVDSWNSLLWDYVPKIYTATKRQSYVLPSPITAKYIKIEFTSLQAEYYNPGRHDRPILYKKFPSWVLNYFLAIYNLDYNKTEDPIITGQTNLRYDLYKLAFNYYKGDILNPITARQPVVIEDDDNQTNLIMSILKDVKTDLKDLDAVSLTNIKAAFDQFRRHPGHRVEDTVVGRSASIRSIEDFFNYSVERPSFAVAETTIVSQTNRNHLLIEKQMPDMYFYPTCRHTYREAYAKFENNKAYFVRIREVRFERKINNIINDEKIYKFVPGDEVGFDRCDFSISKDKWSIS